MPPTRTPVAAGATSRYNHTLPAISASAAEAEPETRRVFATEALPADLPDVRFARGPARRPAPALADPLLQWATGLQTTDRQIYAGWLTEAGKHEDLDLAMHDAGVTQLQIKHGSGNVVRHWALPSAALFVVCDGAQAMSEMRDTPDRFGIAFGWRMTEDGRRQSVLRARVFVQELLTVGYNAPLLLSVKSTLTGDLLACLARHYETLDSINVIRAAAGKSAIDVPFYAVALSLGPGAEVQRGSGQTKTIIPMCEVGARDKAYILSHWCKREWVQAIEALADDTVAWSVRESAAIGAGESGEGWQE